MHFYKTRSFGELISDTFAFLRQYGKNYFKNFIILNGGVILMLILVIAFGYGELIQQLFSSNVGGQQFYFEEYFAENQAIFIGVTLLIIFLSALLSLITYSYPVLYMKRLAQNPTAEITSDNIIQDLKQIWKKFLIYFLGTLFVILPLAVVSVFISLFLTVLIIGFILLIFIFPIIMNVLNFTLFDYYNTDNGFFKSLKFAIIAQFSKKFLSYTGSVIVIYFIISTVTSIISSIPFLLIMAGVYVVPFDESADTDTRIGILMAIFYAIYIVVSIIITNLIYINAGLMYYDAKKEFHRDVQLMEIESLGQNK